MIKTGYESLDNLTGGLHRGELISIIGRPLMGRTMLALNLYKNIILNGNNAAFLTSECPAYKMTKLLNGMMGDEYESVAKRIVDVFDCKSINALEEIIRQLAYNDGVNVIILDSIHYLAFTEVANSFLYEKLADTTRRIKLLAKELGITIIITSRTNYMADEREGFMGILPQLSDTNKMGDWAYYSDVVLGLYRPEVDAIIRDMKGNDLHDVLFVLVLKSRKAITNKFIKYSISSNNCCIKEQGALSCKEVFMGNDNMNCITGEENTNNLADVLKNKGKELWTFLHEVHANLNFSDLENTNQPLFDGVMNILDLIKISQGYKYEFSILHEAYEGYHSTITLQGENLKEKKACHDDIAIGLETKDHIAITPQVIWQIYLFCKLYRGFDYAEWYYGMPIFEISDINVQKFRVAHEEDREQLRQACALLHIEKSSLLPQIISNQDETIHHVKCTWWFPSKGLVQETTSYYSAGYRAVEFNSNKEVLIPYNYGEESDLP